jgi:hypothetical protein
MARSPSGRFLLPSGRWGAPDRSGPVAHQSNYPHSSAKRATPVSQEGARDGRDATGSGSDDRRSPGAPWIGDRTRSPDAPEGLDSGARLSGPCAGSRRATLSWGIDCQTPERASQPAPPCSARTGAHRPDPRVAGPWRRHQPRTIGLWCSGTGRAGLCRVIATGPGPQHALSSSVKTAGQSSEPAPHNDAYAFQFALIRWLVRSCCAGSKLSG